MRAFSGKDTQETYEPGSFAQEKSSDFEIEDIQAMYRLNERMIKPKQWVAIDDEWRVPLERKRRYQARRAVRKAQMTPKEAQEEKFVVHNPYLPVKLPVRPENIFAIISVNGTQYKVNLPKYIDLGSKNTKLGNFCHNNFSTFLNF